MPCRTPAATWGVAKHSMYISNEAASSRDRQDKRLPPSEKTLSPEGRLSPHRACCAQRCSPAEQVGWESQPSFRQKCKKAAGGEKGKDKVTLEGGKLQTNPPLPRGKHLNRHCCGVSNAEDSTQQRNVSC